MRAAVAGIAPQVHAQQLPRHELPGGFFAGSRASRHRGWISPSSTWPAGWLKTRRPRIRSSTIRKRPSRCDDGSNGQVGAPGHAAQYRGARRTRRGACGSVLRNAGDPHLVEFLQVQARDRRLVEAGNAFPAVDLRAIDDGAGVGDAACRWCVPRTARCSGADLDVAWTAGAPSRRSGWRVCGTARDRVQHAHLGEAVAEQEALDELEERRLVVERRFQVEREDGDAAAGAEAATAWWRRARRPGW